MASAGLDEGYSPSFAVQYSAALTQSEFSADEDYVKEVLGVVVALYAAGLVAVVCFWCGLSFRCCFTSCQCKPVLVAPGDEKGSPTPRSQYRTVVEILMYGSLVIALATSIFLCTGASRVTEGVNNMNSAVTDFGGVVDDLIVDGDLLYQYGVNMTALSEKASSSCPYMVLYQSEIDESMEAYMDAVDSMQDVGDSLDSMVSVVNGAFEYYANGAIFYALFGCVALGIVLQIVFNASQHYTGMKTILTFNNFFYLLVITLGAVWCISAVLLGDICKAPSTNFVSLAPAGDARNVTRYFATCVGTSPLDESIQQGDDELRTFNYYLDLVQELPGCGNSPEVQEMQDLIVKMNTTLYHLYNITACPGMNSIYNEFVYDGLCDGAAEGMFYIWGSQLLTAMFLLISIIIGTFAYQMYIPPKESVEHYATMEDVQALAIEDSHMPLDGMEEGKSDAGAMEMVLRSGSGESRRHTSSARPVAETHDQVLRRTLQADGNEDSDDGSDDHVAHF